MKFKRDKVFRAPGHLKSLPGGHFITDRFAECSTVGDLVGWIEMSSPEMTSEEGFPRFYRLFLIYHNQSPHSVDSNKEAPLPQ